MCAFASSAQAEAESYLYSAHGLLLRSAIPLAAPPRPSAHPDVEVRRACLEDIAAALSATGTCARVIRDEAQLRLPGIGTFLVRHGREILLDAEPDANEDLLRLAIAGPEMAALLQQQGCVVLHASAVEIKGQAVGFLGGAGAGKSTIAAALHDRGYAVLTDDLLGVRLRDHAVFVASGFAQLKLWPDALVALGRDPAALPLVRPKYEKRTQSLTQTIDDRSEWPLVRLYVLAGGSTLETQCLSPHAAFLEIVRHSYGIQWLHAVSGAAHFKQRAAVIGRVPVHRLTRPPGLRHVAQAARLVEESFATS